MRHTVALLFCASVLALPAFAAPEATHPAGMAHPATHAAPAAGAMAGGKNCGGMMKDMKATMARIHATVNPAERARLMEKHMAEMHTMMANMHDQMGQMMGQMMDHTAAAK